MPNRWNMVCFDSRKNGMEEENWRLVLPHVAGVGAPSC